MTSSNVNAKGTSGSTALIWAAKRGHEDIVEVLLKYNPYVNIDDFYRIMASRYHLGFWNYVTLSFQTIYNRMENILPGSFMKIF